MEPSFVDHSIAGDSGKAQKPQRMEGILDAFAYEFTKGQITREDTFSITRGHRVKQIRLVLLTYSQEPGIEGTSVTFGQGAIASMDAQGYDSCSVRQATDDGSYDTPHGRLNGEVVWVRDTVPEEGVLHVKWVIRYGSLCQ